jgi:hypothetical protein
VTFSPFPWHRPREHERARRVEPLTGVGFGGRRTVPEPRWSIAQSLAMSAGLGLPLAAMVALLVVAYPTLGLVALAVLAFALGWALHRSRAARKRAADRAAARAATQQPGPL